MKNLLSILKLHSIVLGIWSLQFVWIAGATPALASGETQADAMFHAADSADTSEDYAGAIAKYRSLILTIRQSDPTNKNIPRAKARLARLYMLQKQFDLAEPLFHDLMSANRQTLKVNSELMIDLDDLSDAYLQLRKDPHYGFESMKRCALIRKFIDPNHPHLAEVYRRLSEFCAQCSSFPEAIQWILLAIAAEKQNAPGKLVELARDQTYLSSLYYCAEQLDKSEDMVHQAIATITKAGGERLLSIRLHTSLGQICTKRKQYAEADKQFAMAIKLIAVGNQSEQATFKAISGMRAKSAVLWKQSKKVQ